MQRTALHVPRTALSRCASRCAAQRPIACHSTRWQTTAATSSTPTPTPTPSSGADMPTSTPNTSTSTPNTSTSTPNTSTSTSTTASAGRRWPTPLEKLPSPHPAAADRSVKLHALRSRLALPERFPLQTLARTLVHPSADPTPAFNNAALSVLGRRLLGYYASEWLMCTYPRLPMAVVFAAVDAYIGPKALATLAAEWGIEAAATPGGEVDPGLLQFTRIPTGDALPAALRRQAPWSWNVTTTHKIMKTDEFGSSTAPPAAHALQHTPVPMDEAAQSFVRALVGALHLHLGAPLVKRFFRAHIASRHLDLTTLFDFRTPTRDLSKLCDREGFDAPIARLISETGRLSRHPVFVVGVYSGKDKLGEGAGSSLDEARTRAAAAALKAWYLYRPVEVTLPSSTEGVLDPTGWRPNLIDCGEVVV